MFVAMNRFRIVPGAEDTFEQMWRERDSGLNEVEGFESFRLLKGPSSDECTLYISHSFWRDAAAFEAWTKSDQFRQAHAGAGARKPLYVGGPQFEGFETVLES